MLRHRIAAVAAAIVLLFAGLPAHAQFAFNNVSRPELAATGHAPEASAESTSYKIVRGVVQSRQGVLPGATVWLHGSRTVVVTNAEGEFELRVPAEAQVIELTCGYAGLQDEVVRLPPVQALGSVYLLRPHMLK